MHIWDQLELSHKYLDLGGQSKSDTQHSKKKLNRREGEENRVCIARNMNKKNETKKRKLLSLIPFHIYQWDGYGWNLKEARTWSPRKKQKL